VEQQKVVSAGLDISSVFKSGTQGFLEQRLAMY
jgi:hypothetical protein